MKGTTVQRGRIENIHSQTRIKKGKPHDNRLQDYDYDELGLLGGIPDGGRDHAGRSRANGHERDRGGDQWSAD
jgi:hypothetical protein